MHLNATTSLAAVVEANVTLVVLLAVSFIASAGVVSSCASQT